MTRTKYLDYLASPEFDRVRRAVTRRDRGRCRYCSAPGTEVHHLSYRHIGTEENFLDADADREVADCVLLCHSCHFLQHFAGEVETCEF